MPENAKVKMLPGGFWSEQEARGPAQGIDYMVVMDAATAEPIRETRDRRR